MGGRHLLQHDFDEMMDRSGTEAKKYSVYTDDIIPMWIADTDFKCPEPVIQALMNRVEHGIYGYPHVDNTLGRALGCWTEKRFGWKIKEEWVEYSPAVVPALAMAVQAYTEPGEQVLIQTPVYPPFHQVIENNDRVKVTNSLVLRNGSYEIDFTDLEEKLSHPKTKLMLLCHPHNPTGRVFSEEELRSIGELCLKHHVIVVSDEIHSDLVYPGRKHLPFAMLSEEIANRCLVCMNPSKTFNLAGLRTAGIVIPNAQLREAYHDRLIKNKSDGRTIFGLLALETAYSECDYYAEQLVDYLSGNLAYLLDYFARYIPEIMPIRPEATYLVWLDCRALQMDQPELLSFMEKQAKLGLNDGASFGQEGIGFVRMNIGCPKQVLVEALKRLEKAVSGLRSHSVSV
ncbi:MalY/PatB family protein [Paenibacillus sanguinis]|uniref:MalY/PatB family protein n=1 Tax=Paenibacillus sanguinis TaxID=225906 RepID=UPI0003753840|nr:MalY/PatB family protein [Paenibacillus sanguinis]